MHKSLRIPGTGSADRELARRLDLEVDAALSAAGPAVAPVTFEQRTKNILRPATFADMLGQERMKSLLQRLITSAQERNLPLDHILLVGPGGYGKTTVANIVGNEMGVQVFQVEAPVSHETLLELREVMHDRDILFIDEIHQQAIMERRGRSTSTQPEVLFGIMEDRTLVSGTGVLEFPAITLIGGTTDEGGLPDPFINRFPIRPTFEPYDIIDLAIMADLNAQALGRTASTDACFVFAYACRGVPRQINNYVKLAASLGTDINEDLAHEVLDLSNVTDDGLNQDMQNVLTFMLRFCEYVRASDGAVIYRSGIQNLATGIGKSRDTKAIALRVEPYLIEQGYLQVSPSGRVLTPRGIARAQDLLSEED